MVAADDVPAATMEAAIPKQRSITVRLQGFALRYNEEIIPRSHTRGLCLVPDKILAP